MRRVSDLIDAIRKELPSVYRRQDRQHRLVSQWVAPPLILDESVTVGGVPLKDFLCPPSALTASEFRGVYEEFIEQFLVQKQDESTIPWWLTTRLEMDSRLIPWYFPEGIKAQHALAVLVWLGSGVNASENLTVTTDSITLYIGGTLIGVEGTKVLAKFHQPEVEPCDYLALLEHHEAPARSSRSTELSAIVAELHRIDDPDLQERLRLALRILYFRYPHPSRNADTLYDGRRCSRKRNGKSVFKELQPLITSLPNPAPTLAQRLLGSYLAPSVFRSTFPGISIYLEEGCELPTVEERIQWNEGLRALIRGEKHDG